jgi:hypothetical protein
VPDSLITAAGRLGIPVRTVDLPSLRTGIAPLGALTVTDEAGPVAATSLAPFLLFGFPAAVVALRVLTRTARAQNPVESVLLADDKAAAAARLAQAGVAQVRTEICPFDRCQMTAVAAEIGYPVVVKRTHGAQGRWVRRAADPAALATALAELAAEGPGALIVQPEVVECAGISVRAVLTGGQLIAVTARRRRNGAATSPAVPRSAVSSSPARNRIWCTARPPRWGWGMPGWTCCGPGRGHGCSRSTPARTSPACSRTTRLTWPRRCCARPGSLAGP